MHGFWRRRRRFKDEDPAPQAEGQPNDGPGGPIAGEAGAASASTSGTRRARLLDAGTTAGRATRLLALGAAGAVLVAATPHYLPDPDTNPSEDQYAEQVTVCTPTGADPSNGQTVRLPATEAQSLLREESSATAGPC